MMDEELSRGLRGREPPLDAEHRERLERQLLAAYDERMGRRAERSGLPWLRYATAVGFLLCLVTATQVTAEYKVEVGKRIRLVLPAGQMPSPGLGERVARAFVSESSHLVDLQVILRRAPEGQTAMVVDVWGDRLAGEQEGLERLRVLPELAGHRLEVTALAGRVRDNLLGLVGHSLFRAGASPEEREQARRQLIEELKRREGEGAEIDVEVDSDEKHPRMRVRVRKQAPQPPGE